MTLKIFRKFLTQKAKKGLFRGIVFLLMWFVGGISFAHTEVGNFEMDVSGSKSSVVLATFLDILLLVGILTCFFISVRVKSFLRDGELASGWTLFSLSFVLLFVAQLLSLSVNVSLLDISNSIISSIRLLSILFLASGIYFMKKVLS